MAFINGFYQCIILYLVDGYCLMMIVQKMKEHRKTELFVEVGWWSGKINENERTL